MKRDRYSMHEPCYIFRILTYASLCTCLLNVSVLVVCLSAGRWVFGEAMCQMFAFVSHVTVGGAAWLLALTGLERYYKLFAPAEHQCVFSDINTRIIVIGIYLLIAFIVTSPLYGWGEYTEYRGYFHLTISLSEAGSETPTQVTSYRSITDTTAVTGMETEDSNTCIPRDIGTNAVGAHEINITEFTQVIQSSLKMKWGLQARLWSFGPNMTYLLRAQSVESLQQFLESLADGNVTRYLLSSDYFNCDCAMHSRFLCSNVRVNLTEVDDYRTIFLPFQKPMICSVDFTTVNKHGSGFLALFILTTAIIPFGLLCIITTVIVVRWRQMSLETTLRESVNTARQLVGACISVFLYTPYFVVSIANSYRVYIHPSYHVTVLVCYFSCFLVPCILRMNKNCLKKESNSNHSQQSRRQSMEDIEFELLQSPPV